MPTPLPKPLNLSQRRACATLERWARRPTSAQALALRCRIVLACAEEGYYGNVGFGSDRVHPFGSSLTRQICLAQLIEAGPTDSDSALDPLRRG
jgi:hypothetical protein